MKALLTGLYEIYKKYKIAQLALKRTELIADMPSYYPEKAIKSYKERKKDNIVWAKKYLEANEFYTLYGLDVIGSDPTLYIDYNSFMKTRNSVNQIENWGGSQTILLRDKFLFYKYMSSNNMPVPSVFAFVKNGIFFDNSFKEISINELSEEKDYFIKDIDGECASFVKYIKTYSDLINIQDRVLKGSYILQRRIVQNDIMGLLNKNAINTLRIITINRDGNPYVLSSLLRVGTNKTGSVDNWAAGGIAIGIEKSGFLKKYGFYKPTYGTKIHTHPDSNIEFSTFKVPMYEEALKIACEAHKTFYGLRAIGWDIAISEDGPVFVEGNDNFEITLHQACDRPLKKAWLEVIK